MKLIFEILILIHGIIHLMGYVKAFQLAVINPEEQSISKPMGMLWIFTTTLFLMASILYLLKNEWWFFIAISAVIISQILIIIIGKMPCLELLRTL